MTTLLIRFSAPMQAWGTENRYEACSTRREPTKSGVLGLVASALGYNRNEYPTELNELKFGVRVDREGQQICDFHTARRDKVAYITWRYYLCDAVFLVGLEGNEELLDKIAYALTHPCFPLYLGRRSCPPVGKVVLGTRPLPLYDALVQEPLLADEKRENAKLRIIIDAPAGDKSAALQRDVPITFNPFQRVYAYRGVKETIITKNSRVVHDPMAELEV